MGGLNSLLTTDPAGESVRFHSANALPLLNRKAKYS